MKETGMIFNGEMVMALLEGRKTQTRRLQGLEDVNKNPDLWNLDKVCILDWKTKKQYKGKFGAYFSSDKIEDRTTSICPVVCPYGCPGDRIWVRETWKPLSNKTAIYRATSNGTIDENARHWKPSIHMPRWASRITLEIVNVRVERIQDISQRDLESEGAETDEYLDFREYAEGCAPAGSHIQTLKEYFAQNIWNKIYGTWDSNPWVWVIEFNKVSER